jgi:hypothetical protein
VNDAPNAALVDAANSSWFRISTTKDGCEYGSPAGPKTTAAYTDDELLGLDMLEALEAVLCDSEDFDDLDTELDTEEDDFDDEL